MTPLAFAGLLALAGCGGEQESGAAAQAAPAAAAASGQEQAEQAAGEVVVYKSPTCGCCNGWIDHMEEAGFAVRAIDVPSYDDLARKKWELGVPEDLGSCHTAVVDGYVVEGHVPAEVVERLLAERPDVKGLSVPGMPIGSPGMEGPNPEPYEVIGFDADGRRQVFQRVTPAQPTSDAR